MSPRLRSCMKPMSTTTASEKALGRPFLLRTLGSRSTPQDLTLHNDGDHPVDVAGRCHLPSFGVMGEKQRLCESQELQQAPCSHTSSVVFLTPAMCGCVQGELKTCMSGQLVTGTESLMGMILGVLNQQQGVQQANQIAIRQPFTAAHPQPALMHGLATMEGLLENRMACEKCRTETKSR